MYTIDEADKVVKEYAFSAQATFYGHNQPSMEVTKVMKRRIAGIRYQQGRSPSEVNGRVIDLWCDKK